MLHLVRSIYPNVEAVFSDTGLEYPEIKEFVKTIDNVRWLKPKVTFNEVIKNYGFPVVSKEQSQYIREYRTTNSEYLKDLRWNGVNGKSYKISEKWKHLTEAPFKISEQCCDKLKKEPFKRYQKETGNYPYTGIMAGESRLRMNSYIRNGCNAFNGSNPKSNPLATWVESDIWEYIEKFKLPYSKIYDMGEDRTGCLFCCFGLHLEKGPNKFQRLQKLHPKLHDYCLNKLGFKEVLEYMNIPHSNDL